MSKITVLLVDDNEAILQLLKRMMKIWGFDSILAKSGKEALRFLKVGMPDFIILDYMMPEMDGITTLKNIRQINPIIPVIMFTSLPDDRATKGAEELNVSAFIPKESLDFNVQCSGLRIAVDNVVKRVHLFKGEL